MVAVVILRSLCIKYADNVVHIGWNVCDGTAIVGPQVFGDTGVTVGDSGGG